MPPIRESPIDSAQIHPALGIVLTIGVFMVAGAAGAVYLQLRKAHVEIDKETLCPLTGANETTVVLIDRTDSLNAIQQAAIRLKLEDLKAETPKYGAIEVYSVGEVSDALLRPEVKLCNPGRGADVDPVVGNPRLIEKRWQ